MCPHAEKLSLDSAGDNWSLDGDSWDCISAGGTYVLGGTWVLEPGYVGISAGVRRY